MSKENPRIVGQTIKQEGVLVSLDVFESALRLQAELDRLKIKNNANKEAADAWRAKGKHLQDELDSLKNQHQCLGDVANGYVAEIKRLKSDWECRGTCIDEKIKIIEIQDAEIDRLKKENDGLCDGIDKINNIGVALRRDNEQLKKATGALSAAIELRDNYIQQQAERIKKLEENLRKYGGHTIECREHCRLCVLGQYDFECICGWGQALTESEEKND